MESVSRPSGAPNPFPAFLVSDAAGDFTSRRSSVQHTLPGSSPPSPKLCRAATQIPPACWPWLPRCCWLACWCECMLIWAEVHCCNRCELVRSTKFHFSTLLWFLFLADNWSTRMCCCSISDRKFGSSVWYSYVDVGYFVSILCEKRSSLDVHTEHHFWVNLCYSPSTPWCFILSREKVHFIFIWSSTEWLS
jgi:hypothetical protein